MPSPPSMPDVEPSRGDETPSSSHKHHHSKRHSKSRTSESGSSRRSSHRRSSTSKSEKSPTHSPQRHSPRHSGGGSKRSSRTSFSSGKTPESSKSHKLRLASGAATEIRSPPLLSPSKHSTKSSPTDKGDHSGRSSKRSSRTSFSKTPASKREEKRERNLRIAEPGAVMAPPQLGGPGPRLGRQSASGSNAPTDRATAQSLRDINSNQSLVPLEATAAPNVDEIEAARLQGREEGRKEREAEYHVRRGPGASAYGNNSPHDEYGAFRTSAQNPNDNIVFVAQPAPKDNSARKYAFAAFIIVVIAAAIVVWQVMTGKDDAAHSGPTRFDPPSVEDCNATSAGLTVVGQNETNVRTFAVEIYFAVNSGMNLALLQAELEIRTQKFVLPILIGCDLGGPIVIYDNTYVIQNALLQTNETTMTDPPMPCNISTATSPLCSMAYLEMDLYLQDPSVSSDYLLELIAFVFQHKSLLEVLDLITPIERISTQAQYEVLDKTPAPSLLPSASPSMKPIAIVPSDLPDEEECQEIAATGGGGQGVLQEYDIYMDVMLDILKDDLEEITIELQRKLQRLLMPALAGCDPAWLFDGTDVDTEDPADDGSEPGDSTNPGGSDSNPDGSPMDGDPTGSTFTGGRRLQMEGLILGAKNEAEYLVAGECLTESEPPCYRYVIHLDLFVKSIVASADFTDPIMAKFKEEPLVPRLGLLPPFVKITIVDLIYQTPSAMPSLSPSSAPTTPAPSGEPSMVPSASPSYIPTGRPTPRPTPWPTRPPTRNPTRPPTPWPTPWPTPPPTPPPTMPCIMSNSDLSNAVYNYIYSYPSYPSPTPTPSPRDAIVAQHGPISNWCFGPSVTSMSYLFSSSSFNEDISGWDVSGITDMSGMFFYSSFNQPLNSWDVSSVTNMNSMFYGSVSFNQPLNSWDVSSVTDTSSMFSMASAFNQDLSNWQLTSLSSGSYMFSSASNFNRNLCSWGGRIPCSASASGMFDSTACPQAGYYPYFCYPPYGPLCYSC